MEYIFLFLMLLGLYSLIKLPIQRSKRKKKERKKLDIDSQISSAEYQLYVLEEKIRKNKEIEQQTSGAEKQLSTVLEKLQKYQEKLGITQDIVDLGKQKSSAEKELKSLKKEIEKHESLFRSMLYASEVFDSYKYAGEKLMMEGFDPADCSPYSSDDLKCMQIKELRKLFKENQKKILELVASYQSRYSSKALSTIYQLMVLALEAEMQNILHKLNYGKLETAVESVKELTARYYTIATSGNQTIASTLTKFIGQLEYYYIEAVKIEYEYYVKQERIKEEQRALKEQMRQEAEERKLLEQQKKQVEAEEAKYDKEIQRITEKMESADSTEVEKLREQLAKVQAQLDAVKDKKDDIIKLQNGKAGTVYVISNIGSFGDDVFKVGMTRRLEPMDRIRELGDASVPFPFDVHSFIFSEDASSLETKLHHALNNKRVNKINLRKEFFRVTLDELQNLVEECDPSAAFNRTALAEQYRQSLSINEVPESVDLDDSEDVEE